MAEGIVRSLSIRPDSITNIVVVTPAITPSLPAPTPQEVVSVPSQENYGNQGISIPDSLLATEAGALELAEYLIRPDPNYWFTSLTVNMGKLSSAQRDIVSKFEIGDLVSITKSFKYGTPSKVQKNLFVEGIQHNLTASTHSVDLHFSPVGYGETWQEVTPTLAWQSVASGLTWINLIYNII